MGRGIARSLSDSGATVYATGRSIAQADLQETVRRVPCDHADDKAVAGAFRRIETEAGRLDVLVNNAWGGHETFDGVFDASFWQHPIAHWDSMAPTRSMSQWRRAPRFHRS